MRDATLRTSVVYLCDRHGTSCYASWDTVPPATVDQLQRWRRDSGVVRLVIQSRGGPLPVRPHVRRSHGTRQGGTWAWRPSTPAARLLLCLPPALAVLLASLLLLT